MQTLGNEVVKSLQRRVTVLPFHRDWIRHAFAPDIEIAALSSPRGSAKTWLAGHLAAECIRPGTPLFQQGIEALAGRHEEVLKIPFWRTVVVILGAGLRVRGRSTSSQWPVRKGSVVAAGDYQRGMVPSAKDGYHAAVLCARQSQVSQAWNH